MCKYAITSLPVGETYAYDANGNMTSRVEGGVSYTQNFDIENRLSSVTVNSQTTTFVYDGDGNLVKKLKPDGTSTVYIGGIYEVDLNASSQVTKKTSYYPAGGTMRVECRFMISLRAKGGAKRGARRGVQLNARTYLETMSDGR